MADFNIEHHPQEGRFVINLADGQIAQLRYRYSSDQDGSREVDFYNTHVPDDFRGKGLAARLVDSGFAWADQNQFIIKTSCWYAELKMKRREKNKTKT